MGWRSASRRKYSAAVCYLVAVLLSGLAAAIQYAAGPILGTLSLAILSAAVIGAAWFGGFGPGLLALAASTSIAAIEFWGASGRFVAADVAALLLLTTVGLLISLVIRSATQQELVERDARALAEQRLGQSVRLLELTATLSRAKTPPEVIQSALPDLLYTAEATSGALFLTSEGGGPLDLAREIGGGNHVAVADSAPAVAGAAALAAATKAVEQRIVIVPDEGTSEPGGSAAAIPLVANGRSIGAVVVRFASRHALDPDEQEFLLTAGRHLAQAFERARLYEVADHARADAEALRARADLELRERQKAEEALRLSEARYRALAARTSRLYALNAGLSEAVTPGAVAKVSVREGKVAIGASAAAVALLVDGGTRFQMLYGENYPADEFDWNGTDGADTGLCSTAAVVTHCPVFVKSFAEWQRRFPKSASIAADGGYGSAATLPLLSKGSVLGVMAFYFAVPVNFDEEYTALLTSVALHCAQALDRACLYETAERARSDAEMANRSKDDFLSTISHELRTPLNAMLGWAAMLRQGSIGPERTSRAIESIFNNATRQGRLIEELLDVSRIVAGRVSLDMHEMDLGEILRGAVETIMPLASSKGVDLEFGSAQLARVQADPRRLEQVFLNLLSNAVKFTPAGGRIRIESLVSPETVEVSVADSGVGIDQSFLPHVFERFRQGDSTTTRGVGGLGLGLYIARQLVDAQGGSIRVESEGADRGAKFVVSLPVAATTGRIPSELPAAAPVPEPMPALNGIRVLVVDDEPDAREMMGAALEACGATMLSAASAPEALQLLNTDTKVDLMLSDIAMPGQDGYELIRTIRAMPTERIASLPAAAVTAHARDDERDLALAAGFDLHLATPLHPATLARAVARLASDSFARG